MPRNGISSDKLKRDVRLWAKRVGVSKARLILVNNGVAFSTADFLCQGHYISNPKERLIGILTKVLEKAK